MSKFWYFLSVKEQGLSWLINMVDLIFELISVSGQLPNLPPPPTQQQSTDNKLRLMLG